MTDLSLLLAPWPKRATRVSWYVAVRDYGSWEFGPMDKGDLIVTVTDGKGEHIDLVRIPGADLFNTLRPHHEPSPPAPAPEAEPTVEAGPRGAHFVTYCPTCGSRVSRDAWAVVAQADAIVRDGLPPDRNPLAVIEELRDGLRTLLKAWEAEAGRGEGWEPS